MSVIVDAQKYTGQGRSKKIARNEAAASALRNFIQFKNGAALTPLKPTNLDFTSDDHLENGSKIKTAWVARLQSKYFFFIFLVFLVLLFFFF